MSNLLPFTIEEQPVSHLAPPNSLTRAQQAALPQLAEHVVATLHILIERGILTMADGCIQPANNQTPNPPGE